MKYLPMLQRGFSICSKLAPDDQSIYFLYVTCNTKYILRREFLLSGLPFPLSGRPMLAPGSDVHSLAAPFAIRVLVYNLYSSTTLENVLIP